MSLVKRSTGIHSHLSQPKKKHHLHTPAEDQASATAPQKTRFFEPLKFDDKDPAPTNSNKSIFHL